MESASPGVIPIPRVIPPSHGRHWHSVTTGLLPFGSVNQSIAQSPPDLVLRFQSVTQSFAQSPLDSVQDSFPSAQSFSPSLSHHRTEFHEEFVDSWRSAMGLVHESSRKPLNLARESCQGILPGPGRDLRPINLNLAMTRIHPHPLYSSLHHIPPLTTLDLSWNDT